MKDKISDEINLSLHKDKIYWSIMDAALNLDIQKGHLKWTYTQLSKLSGVSRTSIYYYFGKSKENIIFEAIHFFSQYLLGTTPEQNKKWEEGDLFSIFKMGRNVVTKIPSLVPLFFMLRGKDTRIGKELIEQRKIILKKLEQRAPHLNADELQAIHAMIVGLVFTQGLTDSVLKEGCCRIIKLMKK